MLVFQFGEFGENLHHLVGALAASRHNDDVGVGLFGKSVLKHRLSAAERSGNKARAAFGNRVQRVDAADARLHNLERTRLVGITANGHLHRPPLNHSHLNVVAVGIGEHGNGVGYLIIARFRDSFHSVSALKGERHHNLVRQPALLHLAEPVGGHNLLTDFGQRLETPQLIGVERGRVLATLQEHTRHCRQIVLQAVEIARQKARPQSGLKHIPLKFNLVARFQAARALVNLHRRRVAANLDDFGHKPRAVQVDETDFVLSHRPVNLNCHQV